MTSAVSRRTPGLAVPPTQNTAPVLEFNCLYTHDVRRKQKRWQDGFLRYHTFNRRVMVYDVPRNFIGDTHWQREGDLQQGDEVALEKGGVMVQVAEAVGTTETDLSELLHKRTKASSPSSRVPSPALVRRTPASSSTAPLAPSQLRHKSLNALLGTPKGQVGRALLSMKSPFELSYAGPENDWEQGRSAKRQKTADKDAAWNMTETLQTPCSKTRRKGPPRVGTNVAEPNGRATVAFPSAEKKSHPKQTLREIITLPSETDDVPPYITAIESSANGSSAFERPEKAGPILLVSSSPPPMRNVSFRKQKPTTDRPVSEALQNDLDKTASSVLRDPSRTINKVARSADGVAVSPRTANAASRRDIEARAITVKPCPPRRVSPPVSTKNHLPTGEERPVRTSRPHAERISCSPPADKRAKILRLAPAAPRKMLLCQDLPHSNVTSIEDQHHALTTKRPVSQHERLQQRMAQIGNTRSSPDQPSVMDLPARVQTNAYIGPVEAAIKRDLGLGCPQVSAPPAKSLTTPGLGNLDFDQSNSLPAGLQAMAFDHGRMDEKLLSKRKTVPALPPRTTSVATEPSPRPFRRVVSENDKPPPAADDYDTSVIDDRPSLTILGPISFAGKPLPRTKTTARPATAISAASASTKQPAKSKRPLQRSQSLATPALKSLGRAGPAKEKDTDLGPWSREAFDLFDWRPPDRDREGRKIAVGGNGKG